MCLSLIINADDFGWDDYATEGILVLAEQGKITSTTIMANLVNPAELKEINKIKTITKGLHLNLQFGKPLSKASDVSTLIDKDGLFLPQKDFLLRWLKGGIKYKEIEQEVEHQIKFLRTHDINISHADSHKHIHQYPFIGAIILSVFKKLGIKKVRRCNVSGWSGNKMKVVKLFNILTAHTVRGFKTPDLLISSFSDRVGASGDIFQESINALEQVKKKSIIEFMTHPATGNREDSYLERKIEFDFWMHEHWKGFLKKKNIELITYDDF